MLRTKIRIGVGGNDRPLLYERSVAAASSGSAAITAPSSLDKIGAMVGTSGEAARQRYGQSVNAG